jgi:gliding motility-associated-like protein
MKQVLFILLFLFISIINQAQIINAPDLNCVSTLGNGDVELIWTIPNNPCGPFVSYTIYYATNINGPYTAFAPDIINQFQTVFIHTGANGNNTTYYYYMVSNFNCPGGVQTFSDTLDNLDPVPPVINNATVSGGLAQLNWSPSVSPETYGYIVYSVDALGNYTPIDTLYGANTTSFSDFINSPSIQSQEYTIASIDSCNHTGLINTDPHKTIYATVTTNDCAGIGVINWNAYNSWTAGVKKYELYATYNGGAPVLLDSTTLLADTFVYSGILTCVYIVAYENSINNYTSASNIVCLTPNPQSPVTNLYLLNATVSSQTTNTLFYSVDPSSDVLQVKIERSDDGVSFSSIDVFVPPTLIGVLSYDDPTVLNDIKSYYYRVVMKDNCGTEKSSNIAKTVLLTGYSFSNFVNSLVWDNCINEYGQVYSYEVDRLNGATWNNIQTTFPTVLTYEENVEQLVADTGTLCYVIKANVALSLPNGILDTVVSRSNELCLDQIIKLGVPNAFAPEGVNKIFKPVVRFTGNKSYQFDIYNRWGTQIFTTKDFNEGWDGTYNGKIVEQGAYVYFIQIVDNLGRKTEDKGTVILLR